MAEKITIDALEDLKEKQLIADEVPVLQNESDFESIYQKCIVSKGINFLNDSKSKVISRPDGSFIIAKEQANGNIVAALVIADKQELKQFLSKVIDRYNREELSNLSSDVHRQVELTYIPVTGEKKAEIQITVKQQLNELKEEVLGLTDIENLLNTLDNQGGSRREIGSGQYNELDKLLRKQRPETEVAKQNIAIFKTLIDQAKEKHIDAIRKDIKLIKNNKFTQNHGEATSIRKAKLMYIHAQFTEIERYLLNTDNMQKPFDTSIYNIDVAAYSIADITKLAAATNTQNAELKNINEIAFNTALSKLDLEESDGFRHYLNEVLSGKIDPKKQKYHPKKITSFASLLGEMPMIKGYVDIKNTTPSNQEQEDNDGVYSKIRKPSGNKDHGPNPGNQEEYRQYTANRGANTVGVNLKDADYGEAYTQYGLKGVLKKTFDYMPNMTEAQKNTWTEVAYLGGMGFALFKLGKWFFSGSKNDKGEKTTSFLERLGIVGAVFLGSNMLTGKSPIELIDKAINGGMSLDYLKGKRGESADNAGEFAQDKIVYPGYATRLWGNTKIRDLKPQLDAKTGKMLNYDALLAQTQDSELKELLQNKIGKNDKNNIIPKGLSQLGIRPDSIDNLDQEKTVDEMFLLYRNNIEVQENYRTKNGLILTKKGNEEVNKLVSSGKELTEKDFDALNQKGGIYTKDQKAETSEDKTSKEKLHTQIDGLDLSDEEKKNAKLALDNFYNWLPNSINKSQIAIIKEGGITYLQSGAKSTEKTAIDLKARTINGFGYDFGNCFDVFTAAHLTNRMKEIFGDKAAKSENPFHIETLTGNIVFDDTSPREFYKKDTTAIHAGRFSSKLSNISPVLEEHKQEYCDYLNKIKNWKVANSPSIIPTVVGAIGSGIESGVEGVKNVFTGKKEKKETTYEKFTGLDDKIRRLCGNDTAKAQVISKAMNEFYNQMPNADRTIDIVGTWPVIEFKTYTKSTKINVANKSLVGFTPKGMASYLELFKAANLTNYIKMVCGPKESKKGLPFYIGNPGRDITFNDTSTRSLSTDTEIVSAGRGGALHDISPTLESFKQDYVDYLNRSRDKTGLSEKVRKITGENKERERELIDTLNTFHKNMPNGEKKIDISGTRENMTITTYGKNTQINMEKKSLIGFTPLAFPTSLELFRAANLTNRIKDICKDKKRGENPFRVTTFGRDIEFKEGFFSMNTEIITGGWGGNLSKVSQVLEDNKEEYKNYLNRGKFWKMD